MDINEDLDTFIDQLDGNITLDSTVDTLKEQNSCKIATKIGFRPPRVIEERLFPVRITVKRDNRKIVALTLPKILNYNMRSIWSKYENVVEDINERESDLFFFTEIWQVQ